MSPPSSGGSVELEGVEEMRTEASLPGNICSLLSGQRRIEHRLQRIETLMADSSQACTWACPEVLVPQLAFPSAGTELAAEYSFAAREEALEAEEESSFASDVAIMDGCQRSSDIVKPVQVAREVLDCIESPELVGVRHRGATEAPSWSSSLDFRLECIATTVEALQTSIRVLVENAAKENIPRAGHLTVPLQQDPGMEAGHWKALEQGGCEPVDESPKSGESPRLGQNSKRACKVGFSIERAGTDSSERVSKVSAGSGSPRSPGTPFSIRDSARDLHGATSELIFGHYTTANALAWKCYTTHAFEVLVAVAIVANAVSVGIFTDWRIKNPGAEIPMLFKVVDLSFIGVFSLELLIRILAEGQRFVQPANPNFNWNMFDVVLVCSGIIDEALYFLVSSADLSLLWLRLLRILRLVRVVRIVKIMVFFRELRLMVSGILNCGKALCWAVILLFILTYIYSIFCLQSSADWLDVNADDDEARETSDFISHRFPNLIFCIYTMFKAMSGGVSWEEVADPMLSISPTLIVTFPLYISITIFCVLNVITAVFVDAASRTSSQDETKIMAHIKIRQEWIAGVTKLFNMEDCDGSGDLGWEEFRRIFDPRNVRSQAFFNDMGLDLTFENAEHVFQIFDFDGDGHVNLDEFAQGVHHLQGYARSIDMYRIIRACKRTDQQLTHLTKKVDSLASREPRATIAASNV